MSDESRPTIGNGRYELLGLIGRGGMADVNKAYDTRLGRTVAIKRLRIDLASDSVFQGRFRREAQSAAGLNHPSIVAVYDTGEEFAPDNSGMILPYIVMELVEGRTLRDILHENRKILPERAMEITASVLSALDYSHRAGIVHRDIKPANIMLTPGGDVKVMDFGIARAMADASQVMTQTATVVGTAQYLSPEQARGEQVDARSDLYSTGCVLYELLAGRPPFVGESPVSVAYQHVREEPEPPSSHDSYIPAEADAVSMKALAKRVEDRYQSAAEMRVDLERAIAGLAVMAPLVGDEVDGDATQAIPRQPEQPTRTVPQPVAAGTAEHAHDEDEDEGRRRAPLWIAIAAVIVALLVAGFLVVPKLVGGSGGDVIEVRVPSVQGSTVGVARVRLRNAGLTLGEQRPQFSDSVPEGEIMRQNPTRGSMAERDSDVDVWVSAGEQIVTVPDVTEGDVSQARAMLKRRGLQVVTRSVDDSEEEENQVTRTDPSSGSDVPIGSTVTVYYSQGVQPIPGVEGSSRSEAVQEIKDACFSVNRTFEYDDSSSGTVIDQDPSAGTEAPCSQTVMLTISEGPRPTPTSSSTTEPTTSEPTTSEPTTTEPTTSEPTTSEPTSSETTTTEPTTSEPTTSEPTTDEPTTSDPTTSKTPTTEPSDTEPSAPETTDIETTAPEPELDGETPSTRSEP